MSVTSIQQVQQRLTCPICSNRYNSPKILPCQHTFCLTPCLKSLVDQQSIKCPQCRSLHIIPAGGIESYPNNITILRFLDLNLSKSSFLKISQTDSCSQCDTNIENLGKCLDCDNLFCTDCRPIHLNHLKTETKTAILNLRKILPKFSIKVSNYEQKRKVTTQNYQSIKFEITTVIDQLIEDLRDRERSLHTQAECNLQEQLKAIDAEKENAEIELKSVISFCDNTEAALNNNSNEAIDNEIALIKKQCTIFLEQTTNYDEKLLELHKMNLRITDLTDLSNYIKNFGSLTMQNVIKTNETLFENIENNTQQNKPRQTWNRDLNIDQLSMFSSRTDTDSQQLSTLRPLIAPKPINISYSNRRLETLTNTDSNHFSPIRSNTFVLENLNDSLNSISNETRRLDSNELRRSRARTPLTFNVMLNESPNIQFDFSDSSAVYSSLGPTMPSIDYSLKTRAKLIFGKKGRNNGDLIWPCDVSINQFNNQIVVSDSGNNRVQIFDSNGRFINKFGAQGNELGQFDSLSGIYIDPMANIYLTDRLNHRIQIFDRYCRTVRSISCGPGSAPGQLNFPLGICVNRISERICVFHSSGKFLRSFGRSGSRNGEFDKPYFIFITRENLILISDSSNHRIQVFDSNGNFQTSFGREGSQRAEFKHPRGIAQDQEGFILIADSGNSRIQIFRPSDYTYVSEFGAAGNENGHFMGIEGIQVAPNGDVIVCDRENHRVQIF